MKKIRFLTVLVCFLLAALMLVSCNETGTGEKDTTENSDTVPETDPSTESGSEETGPQEIPTSLTAEVIKRGLVGREVSGKLKYHGWPSICVDEKGTLYAVASVRLRHICPYGRNVMYTSTDGGITWSAPVVINDSVMDERDVGITYLGNGKMLISYFYHSTSFYFSDDSMRFWRSYVTDAEYNELVQTWGALSDAEQLGGSFVRISEDYGKTWGEPVRVPISAPHGPVVTNSGKLLYVGSASYGDLGTGIYAVESADDGKSWKVKGEIPIPENLLKNGYRVAEPHVVQLSNNRILVAIRYQGSATNDIDILTCYSDDWGYTWTMAKDMDFNGAPPHLLELDNGVVVLSYAKRTWKNGICARLSYDRGETWSDEILLDAPNDRDSSDLGYPATVQLEDGSLVTVYYRWYESDRLPSIMYTKWKLNETE